MKEHKAIVRDSELTLEYLVKTYNFRLVRVIQPFVRNSADLEDILQESWTKVYLGIKKFRNRSQIFTWIYRIAVNSAINHIKKKKPDSLTVEPADPKRSYDPEGEFKKKEIRSDMFNAIKKLSKTQREVFLLRVFDNLNYEEVSALLGLTANNAKSTYYYAIKRLQKILKDRYGGFNG